MSDILDEFNASDIIAHGLGEIVSPGKIITARGTEEGLVLRIDGRSEWPEIIEELRDFLKERKSFLEGGEVSLEWLDRLPTKLQSTELEQLLAAEFGIRLSTKKKKAAIAVSKSENIDKAGALRMIEARRTRETTQERFGATPDATSKAAGYESSQLDRIAEMLGEQAFYDEDANAKIFFGTLRSGQRIETPYSLVIVGDVNPGADLVAGGDIVVVGSLRGTAHASAYDEDCFERVIIALQMQPMQLRIGSVISRGNGESHAIAEIARIEERRIVVDAYNPRKLIRGRVR